MPSTQERRTTGCNGNDENHGPGNHRVGVAEQARPAVRRISVNQGFFLLIIAAGMRDFLNGISHPLGHRSMLLFRPYPSPREIGAPAHRPRQMV